MRQGPNVDGSFWCICVYNVAQLIQDYGLVCTVALCMYPLEEDTSKFGNSRELLPSKNKRTFALSSVRFMIQIHLTHNSGTVATWAGWHDLTRWGPRKRHNNVWLRNILGEVCKACPCQLDRLTDYCNVDDNMFSCRSRFLYCDHCTSITVTRSVKKRFFSTIECFSKFFPETI